MAAGAEARAHNGVGIVGVDGPQASDKSTLAARIAATRAAVAERLDSMVTERQFFTDGATRTRADLRVNGSSDISHDQESEVVLLD